MGSNSLVPTGVGSYDWAGYKAPPGGVHTGVSTIRMIDGTTYVVAHGASEVRQRVNTNPGPPTLPAWCAFDQVGSAIPVILDLVQIGSVS